MTTLKKFEIEKAIKELVEYAIKHDIDPNEFIAGKETETIISFKEYLYDVQVQKVLDKLYGGEYKEYKVETIVFEVDESTPFEQKLILEWEQYKKIPKTNLTYRYDVGNTNTKTIDHIHVFSNNNQLYAINKNGTAHDGSKAKLGKKEIKFLKNIGFTVPPDGILEWVTLDNKKSYSAIIL